MRLRLRNRFLDGATGANALERCAGRVSCSPDASGARLYWIELGVLAQILADVQRLDLESGPSAQKICRENAIVNVLENGANTSAAWSETRPTAHAGV